MNCRLTVVIDLCKIMRVFLEKLFWLLKTELNHLLLTAEFWIIDPWYRVPHLRPVII